MNEIAMRMLDLALLEAGAKKYRLEHKVANSTTAIEMKPNEIAVSLEFEARTEDTAFEVGITSDVESILYSSETCLFWGQTSWGADIYNSKAAVLHRGGINIEAAGTPTPSFQLHYIKATITEYATD